MFTKTYCVKCTINMNARLKSVWAIVNAGNSRGVLTKFLFHINEKKDFPSIDPHTSFILHKDPCFDGKVYWDNTHTICIQIKQFNPHSDCVFVGDIDYLNELGGMK